MSTDSNRQDKWQPSAPKAQACIDLFETLCTYPPDPSKKTRFKVAELQKMFDEWATQSGALLETSKLDSFDNRWKTWPRWHDMVNDMLVRTKGKIEDGKSGSS